MRCSSVMDDGLVSDIKRGGAARNAKLAGLGAGMAGRAALGFGKRLTGKSKDEVNAELMDKAAQQLFTVLGELKGGAMKVGQALVGHGGRHPRAVRQALPRGADQAAAGSPAAARGQGAPGARRPAGHQVARTVHLVRRHAGGVGQHRPGAQGGWSDGREVAVKIQYPGADEALRADLKTMQRMVRVLKQLSPGADVQGVVDELIERTEMELDYRLEADNQRAFAKAYEGHPHFVVPHIVASAPKVVIQEWIEGIPMSVIIREGTQEQRDLMGTRLFELTYDAPRRLEMMHGDAHPGNFMLLPDDKMGVIDFGAVAPMPGGIPVELGMATRYALNKDYDHLLPTMQQIGFIQKGEQVSEREMDEMMRQYVEPLEVEVFHYTRKWLQRMTAMNMNPTAPRPDQGRAADGHSGQAGDPDAGDRVQRRDLLPARCARASQKRLPPNWFRVSPNEAACVRNAGRPARRRRLPAPRCSCVDAHADACARRSCRVRGSPHPKRPTARHGPAPRPGTPAESGTPRTVPWRAPDRRGSPRTTSRDRRHDMARPAASSFGMSGARHVRSPASWSLILFGSLWICDQVIRGCPKNYGHGSGDFGSVAIWLFEGFLGGAPIHGRDNRGGGTRLARRNRSGGGDAPRQRRPR